MKNRHNNNCERRRGCGCRRASRMNSVNEREGSSCGCRRMSGLNTANERRESSCGCRRRREMRCDTDCRGERRSCRCRRESGIGEGCRREACDRDRMRGCCDNERENSGCRGDRDRGCRREACEREESDGCRHDGREDSCCRSEHDGECTRREETERRNCDMGPEPYMGNICEAAEINRYFRTAFWTGGRLQTTLMCIEPNDDIGVECHSDTDQLLVIVDGDAAVKMGGCKDNMRMYGEGSSGTAIFVPAGTWHNVLNTSTCRHLKLFSVYAPPHHRRGTVHRTKAEAQEY